MPKGRIAAQEPDKRIRNFSEVVVGISRRKAIENAKIFVEREASAQGESCPLGTDVFGFLKQVARTHFADALKILHETNPLVGVTSRFCIDPYEKTNVFNKAGERISIREIEQCVVDTESFKYPTAPDFKTKPKVAIIGSGPSGLMAAFTLIKLGYSVTIYDSLPQAGGALTWAFPTFRLPKSVLEKDLKFLQTMGVRFKLNCMFGQSFRLRDLFDHDYQAVIVAVGASQAQDLNIDGEHLGGVMGDDDFLLNANLLNGIDYPKSATSINIGKRVAVIGGGNAALDCARMCVRLGSEVTVIVNGDEDDLKVKPYIARHAREEGVKFEFSAQVKKISGNHHDFVESLLCRRLDYVDPAGLGNWELREIEDSDFTVGADTVIVAVGHRPNGALKRWSTRLALSSDGLIKVDDKFQTSIPRVFACGNAVDGPGPMYKAMLSGKTVAESLHVCLKS